MTDPVRIGNCSGFYGDRLAAMREMLTGGDLNYLTGDYLAELTMLILGKDQLRDPSLGYARTFLAQMSDTMGLALDKGVRIVLHVAPRTPLDALSLQPSLVLSLRRRLALVRVRSLTAFARVVIRGTVLASLRSLAAGTVGGWVRFARS